MKTRTSTSKTWIVGDPWYRAWAGELTITAESGSGLLRLEGSVAAGDLSQLAEALREAEEFAGIRQSARQLGPTVRTHCA